MVRYGVVVGGSVGYGVVVRYGVVGGSVGYGVVRYGVVVCSKLNGYGVVVRYGVVVGGSIGYGVVVIPYMSANVL